MSQITVSAELVIQCCNNFNTYNDKQDCLREAKYIREYANNKRFIIFGEKWGYQKAFEYLENNSDFDTFGYSIIRCKGRTGERVDNLRLLAQNGDPVIITDNDAFIFNFKEI